MPIVNFSDWRAYLSEHPDHHLLQSAEWGELKAAFGWDVERLISGNTGIQILFRKLPLGFTIAYAPKPIFGSNISILTQAMLQEIDALCRKKHAIFLKIEPDAWDDDESIDLAENPWQFKSAAYNIQPPRTVVIDLAGSDDEILLRMKQKCRYNIRLAEKKNIIVRSWNDLEGFFKLMQVTGGRDGFGVHSLDYYRKAYDLFAPSGSVELLLAEFEGRPLAALMIFACGERSWYLYGASNDQERSRMPAYLLQWHAIKWAQARGCKTYDMWGVPDESESVLEAQFENRHDGLWGVYRFKRGFGGRVVRAAQSLDRVYIPLLYRLYLKRMGGLL
ncbi:MAG: peptidoglycan bridge formation glycyltransferase FemA/FemB family protein [Chloroflexota bacterium]